MKTRSGFVSNSSTSSYVCDICGEECSGMDLSISEAEMQQCRFGHTFCTNHGKLCGLVAEEIISKSRGEKITFLREYTPSYQNDIMEMTIASTDENKIDESIEDLCNDLVYEVPPNFCPCCQLHEIVGRDELTYLRARANMSQEQVHEEMRAQFSSLQDMTEKLELNKKSQD